MAIRNEKLGGVSFNNGEVLYDYDLDDTNNAIIDNYVELIGRDGTNGDITISIPSNKSSLINNGILVMVTYTATSDNGTCVIDVQAGETGTLSSINDSPITVHSGSTDKTITEHNAGTVVLFYSPTAAEKSNGFDVSISGTAGTSANISLKQTNIIRV